MPGLEMNPSTKPAPESPVSQIGAAELDKVYGKIARRIIPFLVLLFLMAWLDRYNLGFAKLQMVKDLGFSEAVYGFGAGVLYLGYALFEVPSNLLLERIGARKTFARITILWGITSLAMMSVKTAGWYYFLRFLLGSFEAGLFPGVVVYLTYWFPARRRARMLAGFQISIPVSVILGSPISGWIMESMGGTAGLANWQWLFVLEGIPSILMGVLALAIIVDKPEQARWLTESERRSVLADLESDRRQAGPREHGFGRALKGSRLWLLALMYFCVGPSGTTIGFWIPSIIRGLGARSNVTIGLLSAVPYIVAVIAMILMGQHSDRTLERRFHSALGYLAGAAGLVGIGVFANNPALAFAALVIAVACPVAGGIAFWQIPSMVLAGTGAAGGIALINSIGALASWVCPSVVGWLEDVTGKTASGLYVVAGLVAIGSALILLFVPRRAAAGEPTRSQHK
jgi:D-galactonate transporter